MLNEYFNNIYAIYIRGDAREESFYSELADLMKAVADNLHLKHFDITILPKKTEAGNPDFRVWDGKLHYFGYIESKTLGTDLNVIERSEQLKRYLDTFPNLILTNFIEFRVYRNGKRVNQVIVGDFYSWQSIKPIVKNEAEWLELMKFYFSFSLPKITTSKQLAIELANRAKFLKDQIVIEELANDDSPLHGFYDAFKQLLLHNLKKEEFSDLYAQTVAYGLFAARTKAKDFDRRSAYSYIPQTIGVLKDIFSFISLAKIPPQLESIIDDISEVLAVTDVNKILDKFYEQGKGKDPIIHFYETFLYHYDPDKRKQKGVYYTPEPVVSYIVRSLNLILKEKFNKKTGLADKQVTLLDPAGGTLGFLSKAIEVACEEQEKAFGKGLVKGLMKEHILPHFHGFELMMAPYAMGHLKMAFILKEHDYEMQEDERFKYYLTNTLDTKEIKSDMRNIMQSIAEESDLALEVKEQLPILVVLGNPPYSGQSDNVTDWTETEIQAYFQIDGKPLKETNSKGLQDDYVKFIRFAQWKIDQSGQGVVGFITNHAYLDNPTFRGMRQSLMKSFDEMFFLDLHGNSKKKEKSPDGSKDENVFDIQQGVAICFLIKYPKPLKAKTIKHADLFGLRESKYDYLEKNNINSTTWTDIVPVTPFYLLQETNQVLYSEYMKYPSVTDIFDVNGVGIVTARDHLTMQFTPEQAWNTVLQFANMPIEQARIAYDLGEDTRDWKVEFAQKDLKSSGLDRKKIVPVLYRPFDIRFTYYTGKSRGFHCTPRNEVMQHMLKPNLAILTVRQVAEGIFNHIIVTENIADSRTTLSNKGYSYIFPLYFHKAEEGSFISDLDPSDNSNIPVAFLNSLKTKYGKDINPEDIFYYCVSILHSTIYRTKYSEFLRLDFPRIPFVDSYQVFMQLSKLGEKLSNLHLLKDASLDQTIATYPISGSNTVDKVVYKESRVYINATQYFEPVSPEIWEYHIGGYHVAEKWLKDRKHRILSTDEIIHYEKVITALHKTMEVQVKIDEIYEEVGSKFGTPHPVRWHSAPRAL